MKKRITTLMFLLYFVGTSIAQNTADLFIENPTVNASQTKFSWEIHLTETNDWGSLNRKALGNCSFYFDYNNGALSNPVITYVAPEISNATDGYSSSTGLTGGKVQVTLFYDNNKDGVNLTTSTKYHLYTVEMDITDPNQQSMLAWDPINTGILNAQGSSVDESYVGNGDVALPVELTTLNVEQQNNDAVGIHWETATELNNYGFEIQRVVLNKFENKPANPGDETAVERDWKVVGFVKGSGNSNAPKKYSYVDKNLFGGTHFIYRLKQIDIDGSFDYSGEVEIEVIPTKYELSQNYPNPFNPSTTIKFSLPEKSKVRLDVYNMIGELVATLINKELEAGFQKITFNASGLTSGVYFYRINTGKFNKVRKMLLLK